MTERLHERTIRLIPILMLLMAVAIVVPAMAAPAYTSVEINSTKAGENWVILNFDESVGWKPLGETDIIVQVGDANRPIDPVPARSGLNPAMKMDLAFIGGALEHGDTVNVTITQSGAAKILNPVSLESMPDEEVSKQTQYLIPPEFVSATTDEDGTQIIIELNKTMVDPNGKHSQFNYTIGEKEFAFTVAELDDDETKIVLTCDGEIAFGNEVTVSYTKGDVKSDDNGVLQSFAGKTVDNIVPEPPVALYANTTTDGDTINITFSMEMDDPAGKHDQFTFFVNDVKRDFSGVELSADNLTFSLEVVGEALIAAGDVVNVSYTRGYVTSQGKGKLASFENLTVENNVPASPVVVAAKTDTYGNQVIVKFDVEMADPAGKAAQFRYRVNDGSEEGFYHIARQEGNTTLVLYKGGLFFNSSDTVNLTYERGDVRALDHGVLLNFTNITVENVMPPEFVQIDPITDAGAATKTVTLNFSKPVWWSSPLLDGDSNAIVVKVNGDTRVITEIGPRDYKDASNLLDVTFSGPAIIDDQTVHVTITSCGAGKVKETSSENNTMSGSVTKSETYVLPPTPPVFEDIQFVPECGGTNVRLYFDKPVYWENALNGTHITVTVDGTPVEFADIASPWRATSMMTLVLSEPITKEGQVVNITITDAGAAEIKETEGDVPMDGGASVEKKYAAPPEFVGIRVTDAENGKVELRFSKPVFTWWQLNTYYDDIKAMVDGEYRGILGITVARSEEDANETIVVKLASPMITEGQTVEVTITADGAWKICETVGKVSMLGGNTQSVTYTVESAPEFVKAWTNEFGSAIIVEFDKDMAGRTDQWDQFKFVVNDGEEKDFDTWNCRVDGDNKKRIVLSIGEADTIKAGDTVNLTYTPGKVAAEDGGLLAAFDERVTNKKRPILTGIEVTKVAGDGNLIKLQFDEPVSWNPALAGGLDIKATVAGSAREVVDVENRTAENATDELIVTVKGAEITEGQSVAITVTKSGADKIVSNDKPLIECTTSTQYKVYHGAPYIKEMFLVSHVDKEVGLWFSDYVSWDDLVNGTHVIVEVDGVARRAYKVDSGSGRWLSITFDGDIIKVGQTINVTVTEEGAKAISLAHGKLAQPYEFSTTFTKTDGPVIETAETDEYGNLVYITFDKALESYVSPYGFRMHIDGWEWYSVTFQSAWLEGENKTLVLEIDNDEWVQVIKPGNKLAISGGYIFSEDGGVLAKFEKHPVENKVTKTFDQIQPLNCGWNLVSTPRWIDPTASEFVDAVLVYKYDAATDTFSIATVKDIKPVEALYVKTAEGGWFAANFAEFQPLSTKELSAGWNLISVGTWDNPNALLSPLRFIQVGQVEGTGITTLVSQGALNRITPNLYLPTLTEKDWEELEEGYLSPFDGYWIYMNGGKDFGVLPGEWGEWEDHWAAV